MKKQNFALIDNASGYVWWTGAADSAEAACAAATLESGSDVAQYERAAGGLALNESGYHVYAAPAGYGCDNGQDEAEIAAVEALERIGTYRRIGAE